MAKGDYIKNHVYNIVNELAEQATGRKDIAVIDTASFVDLGNNILNSADSTEGFLSALTVRIARTYFTYRPYTSSLIDLVMSDFEWGAVVQKIDAEVPDFVQDETFELEEGKSVDMYVVRKPTASQKLFIKRATYSNFITIQRKWLQDAFLNESAFAQFVNMLVGKMRTKLEFALENLARMAIANFIANAKDSQIVHIVSNYNTESGNTLSPDKAMFDKDCLAYAVGEMELYSKRMRNLSVSYNAEGRERHTPMGEQKFLVYDKFQTRLQTQLQYQAFHDELVRLKEFIEVPYWQGENERQSIKVTIESDGIQETKTVENLIGFIFDRYALGTFRKDEETLTTPLNARGRYYNTFHFAEQLWFNDMSENGVAFCWD